MHMFCYKPVDTSALANILDAKREGYTVEQLVAQAGQARDNPYPRSSPVANHRIGVATETSSQIDEKESLARHVCTPFRFCNYCTYAYTIYTVCVHLRYAHC